MVNYVFVFHYVLELLTQSSIWCWTITCFLCLFWLYLKHKINCCGILILVSTIYENEGNKKTGLLNIKIEHI